MSAVTQKLDVHALRAGVLAGLIGGVPFGMMMAMMGMLPMIGMLVGLDSALAGVFVHAAISAVTGAVYGLFAPRLAQTWRVAVLAGMAYGIVWWVLGALVLMPALLGMYQNIFVIGTAQWLSLMGHIVFGLVLALSFFLLYRRAFQPRASY